MVLYFLPLEGENETFSWEDYFSIPYSYLNCKFKKNLVYTISVTQKWPINFYVNKYKVMHLWKIKSKIILIGWWVLSTHLSQVR